MVQMDGIASSPQEQQENPVLLVGCTNCPWNVDDAVLRRFPRRIYIPLPDAAARKALLEKLLAKAVKHNVTSRQISQLVQKLDGFSCSDISSIASEASFGPLRDLGGIKAIQNAREDQIRPISANDFETAIAQSTKSVSPALLQKFSQWEKQQSAK
jgi:SpoVK/Ycf46/Vps4 family AAA+-type ATPase